MSEIDLSKFANINGRSITSGLSSGLDIKSIINSMLKDKIDLIDEMETKNNNLSEYANALANLQNKVMQIKSSINSDTGIKSTLSKRKIEINGQPSNNYIQIYASDNTEIQNFNISNIKTARAKTMISKSFSNPQENIVGNLKFDEGIINITKPTKIQTEVFDFKINNDYTNLKILKQNFDNLLENIKRHNLYQDFNGQYLQNVTVNNISNDKVFISLIINNKKYISNTLQLNQGVLPANSQITFFNSDNNMKFDLWTHDNEIDLSNNNAKQDFSYSLQSDLNSLNFELVQIPTNFYSKGLLSQLKNTNINFNLFNTFSDLFMSPFIVKPSIENDGSISVYIDNEKYVSTALDKTLSGPIILTSTSSNKNITIDLKEELSIDISHKDSAKLLETSLNNSFGIDKGEEVEITNGDTLHQLANKINEKTKNLNISARVTETSKDNFCLVIESNTTGIENDFIISGNNFNSNFSIQNPRNASLTFKGVNINRPNNIINDLVSGISFHLLQDTDNNLNINIALDDEEIKNSINNFIKLYNDLQIFSAKQREVDSNGLFVKTAILKTNYTLDSINHQINDNLTAQYDNSNLSELGLIIQGVKEENLKYNKIILNSNKLYNTLKTNQNSMINLLRMFSTEISESIDNMISRNSLLRKEMNNIHQKSHQNTVQAEQMQERITREREKLLERYTNLERTVVKANSIINLLKAQQNALNTK